MDTSASTHFLIRKILAQQTNKILLGWMLLYSLQPLAQIAQSCYQSSLLKQDQILFLN